MHHHTHYMWCWGLNPELCAWCMLYNLATEPHPQTPSLVKKKYIYLLLYVYECMPGAHSGQKKVSDLLEPESQMVVSQSPCGCWEFHPGALKHWAISSHPSSPIPSWQAQHDERCPSLYTPPSEGCRARVVIVPGPTLVVKVHTGYYFWRLWDCSITLLVYSNFIRLGTVENSSLSWSSTWPWIRFFLIKI